VGIAADDVARVREATDLVALAGEHLALKRVGQRFVGLCPFHAEKTPSFSINPALGVWYCFGCQARGDAITFVREVEHVDFVEAVERLAARAGITLHYDDQAVAKDRSRRQRLVDVVAAAIAFYQERLLTGSEGAAARRYLRGRGFEGDAARRFVLGWAPDDFDQLSLHLQKAGFGRNDIVDAGLAFVNRVNRLQDQFRARLMFPIFDTRGDAVGFGGRALVGDGPKYKNSPETSLYQKSHLLYGLNWAKAEIVKTGEVVICEGYTDVMAFVLAGIPQAVATCGTALADEHFQILKNLARKVTLAYDSDAAGQGAAERWYGWEQRYEIQLQVAALPVGRDPADVWRDSPEALRAARHDAAPFMQFRVDRVLSSADLTTIEGRARAADDVAAIVGAHPNELVRDQYVMQLADRLTIEPDVLRSAMRRAVDRRPGARAGEPPPPSPRSAESEPPAPSRRPVRTGDRRETDLLLWAIHEPELVADWLDASLFLDPVTREGFTLLASSLTFRDALDHADGPVRDLLERLAVEVPDRDGEPETVRPRLLVNTVLPAATRVLDRLTRADDARAMTVKVLLDALVHARDTGDWGAVQATATQLLGWIADAEVARR
jgi:DNA primase